MRAGNRNRRVDILRRATQRDAANDLIPVWSVVSRAWASIKYVSGVAAIKAGADQAINRASIRLTYRRGLEMDMRIKNGADVYAVEAVLPDEKRRRHVDLVCRLLTARELAS